MSNEHAAPVYINMYGNKDVACHKCETNCKNKGIAHRYKLRLCPMLKNGEKLVEDMRLKKC